MLPDSIYRVLSLVACAIDLDEAPAEVVRQGDDHLLDPRTHADVGGMAALMAHELALRSARLDHTAGGERAW